MVDGPITIPLMKRTGFRPPFAAAVEAVASTGGQLMPPVMGAAAFVMAEFLAVPYAQVALWAAIPAVLYYVARVLRGAFRGQALQARRRAEVRAAALRHGDGGARPPVHADLRRALRADARLFGAAVRAHRRARLHPDRPAAPDARAEASAGATSSTRWSTARATRCRWRWRAPARASSSAASPSPVSASSSRSS